MQTWEWLDGYVVYMVRQLDKVFEHLTERRDTLGLESDIVSLLW